MKDEDRKRPEDKKLKALVKRYEEMLDQGQNWYFDIDQFEDLADYYFTQGKAGDALQVLHGAMEMFPKSPVLLLREAQILASIGKLSQAIPKLKAMLAFEPNNNEIHLTLATIYNQTREFKKSISHYQEALQHSDKILKDEIYLDLAMVFENSGNFKKAMAILKLALKKNPENESALHEMAFCFDESEENAEGAKFFKDFTDENPYSFPAWYCLGNCLLKIDRDKEAAIAFEFCLAIQDDFTPGYINLANAYIELELYFKAIESLYEVVSIDGEQASLLCLIGECFEKMEQPQEALENYERALIIDAGYADAYVGKAIALEMIGRGSEAMPLLEKAHELEPDNPEILLIKADLSQKEGDVENAAKQYKLATMHFPMHINAWLDYADFLYRQQNIHQAILIIDKGLMDNDENPSLLYRKVAYLHAEQKVDSAIILLKELRARQVEGEDLLMDYYPEIMQDKLTKELFNEK